MCYEERFFSQWAMKKARTGQEPKSVIERPRPSPQPRLSTSVIVGVERIWGDIHAAAQKSTIPIALRTDCRTQKVKRFRFVALPEFIRTLLLASQRPHIRSTPINEGKECH